MTIFYFTSTGNCLHVAKSIARDEQNIYSIPKLLKENNLKFKDDVIGIVYPTYGFGMPKIVKEFLSKVSWEANYSFAIATYGNMRGAVCSNTERLANSNNISFNYMNTLLMVDNYLPGFDMDKQIKKLKDKKIDENIENIIRDIKSRKNFKPNEGLGAKLLTAMTQKLEGIVLNGEQAKKYIINNDCVKCGICAKVCPTGNIKIEDKPVFLNKCEACLGCVHICPHNAIHLKSERSSTRFRNENISIKEIVDSNCQTKY